MTIILCHRCNDAPATKRHRDGRYCIPCAALARWDTAVELGVELEVGFAVPTRRDHDTPDQWWCQCPICGAEWVDTPGLSCWRCERIMADKIAAQARAALRPPDDVHVNPRARSEWSDRLRTAVDIGIVTMDQARHAISATFDQAESA